ncbi:hypothetical protein ACFPA8_07985 [Streptomyces ovatisporus]|uniref:Uncharacterized protein n=1 Tax=Streptomyces ovatisporus TaxID=1128682 RepID=A0ABV9A4P3_9ACTN
MAVVTGPNGYPTYVPDDVATGLVGDGTRGYAYVAEAKSPEPKAEPEKKPAPRKRAPRKPKPAAE